MLWVHWRSLLARLRRIQEQSRLMLFVLGAFVIGYLVVGYWLFYAGLNYLQNFPILGALLSQRILYLIFGFFFVMLVFSNLIIGYSALFKNREMNWLLTLPISHKQLYRWKFIESLAVSSWALIFFSAPMMVAYGRVHNVPAIFYVQVIAAYLPFVVIPALLGSWLLLLLVRVLSRSWVKKGLLVFAVLILAWLFIGVKPITELEAASQQDVLSINQLLRHTRVSLYPLLPSAWLSRAVIAWREGLAQQGGFFFLVLLSNALMGLLVGFEVAGRFYYGSWAAVASSRAERFQRKAEAKRQKGRRRSLIECFTDWLPFVSRPVKALALKDARMFARDPAQWIQFAIFFGLLCMYVLNLRNIAFDFRNEFWEMTISYLNLAASALTLSTLTTRFVFPQFSLEGRRLWIVGLAPVGLGRVLLQKFWLSSIAAMAITVSLNIASSLVLNLPPARVLFFAGSIALMSATMCGLAVGLGALFPNMKEDNPSKVVSGFGGTLCLVVSFVYIACFVALVAVPGIRRAAGRQIFLPDAAAIALAVALSLFALGFPMFCAIRRVKNLEF